jgi:chromosome segregation ATPase
MDNGNGNDNDGDYPVENAENPVSHRVSHQELACLRAQADESLRLQAALNVALQSIQDITAEKNAINNDKADTERLLQETHLSLQTQTQKNSSLVQQQEELNQCLQVLAIERDDAVNEKDNGSRIIAETRELLQAQVQRNAELTQQLDIASSRERDLTLERDSATTRGNSLEAQLGPLREQVKELNGRVECIPNLHQSLDCARLEAEQLPVLQEQLTQSSREIKSLRLSLSTQLLEKKRLLHDLEAKRRRDIDATKNASKLEAEKQVQAALNKNSQQFWEQVLQCLQNLSLPSDELKDAFSQSCSEKYSEGCYLNDLFGILQQLIDHIYTNHGDQMLSVERQLKDKVIEVQELDSVNQTHSAQLKDATLAAKHLKAICDSLQVKLDAARVQIQEKNSQVESLRSDSGVLETSLAKKTQLYETAVTQLRSVTSQVAQSKQEVAVAIDERNKLIKSHEKQIAIKDVTISQLTTNVYQHEQSLRGTKADLNQKLNRITELEFIYQQQQEKLAAVRGQVLELETQFQHKDTSIASLSERVLMLEAKSKTDAVELEKLTNHSETQLTQANASISDLVFQVNVLSNNSVTLQGKLDVAIKENDAVTHTLAEKVASVAQLETALETVIQRALVAEARLNEKDDEITALKSQLDARDAMVKPHELKGTHPLFGMMNLRGCAWYWWTTLPSALIPSVNGLSI